MLPPVAARKGEPGKSRARMARMRKDVHEAEPVDFEMSIGTDCIENLARRQTIGTCSANSAQLTLLGSGEYYVIANRGTRSAKHLSGRQGQGDFASLIVLHLKNTCYWRPTKPG
jgi:hypothetical protein